MSGSERRALVVEHDKAIRQLIAAVLKRERFEVIEDANAREAITRLEDGRFMLIILDLLLRGGGGEDVIAYLRNERPTSLRRVVIITGAPRARVHALPGDICAVLGKPFDLEALISAVRTCTE